MKTVLIGIGNEFRGDDAVGRILVRRLAALELPGLEIRESSGECFSLMELWTDAERVILVDALQSGSAPGTIRRIDASTESIPADLVQQCSTHSLSLLEAVEMARALEKLPPEVLIYGIEGHRFEPGEELSPEVAQAVDEAFEQIQRECVIAHE
ncbi:MAG: hydrogenase maturation protease [Verrucomicrobiales bacterium]|nr:hydrogenase maturation protease [Verrucomicrobiales bacterium]